MTVQEWILQELHQRGWTINELARRTGISSGGMSMIVNGLRKPGPDSCRAIARALDTNPIEVFQRAGLLAPEPDMRPIIRQAIYLFASLSDDAQELVLREMEAVYKWEKQGAPKMADAVRVTAPGYIMGKRE